MKNIRKILLALLVLLTVLIGTVTVTSFAADDVILYLTPNSNWRSDNARFAMYVWTGSSDYKWIDMTDSNGDGVYEGVLPAGYTNVIFCRMNPDSAENGWSNGKMWNQTKDLEFDGTNNHYKIASGAWDKGEGSWSIFDSNACVHSYENDVCTKCGEELFYIIAGNVAKINGEYADGDNSTIFVSEWDVTDESNRMKYDNESGCYVKIYENVAKGEYHFKVAENKSWDISYGQDGGNCYLRVEEDGSTVVITLKDGSVTCSAKVINAPEQNPDENGQPDSSDDSEHNEPEAKLNFFQRIWRAIVSFFRNLFGKKK